MILEYSSSIVKWNNGEKNVEYHVEGIEFASEENNMIYIETYKNNIFEYYYVDRNGYCILSYSDELEKIVVTDEDGNEHCTNNLLIKEAVIDSLGRIYVLIAENNKDKLLEYSRKGDVINEFLPPNGYTFYRFGQVAEDLQIICQGDEKSKDKYGRNDWKFTYNFDEGEWNRDTLAY